MATKNNTLREELIRLQKRIYNENKRIIEESVIHEDRTFKAYEKRYLKAVKNFKKTSSFEETQQAIRESNLIFVGDYHTLNQSQRSLLRIIRNLDNKNVVLVLEMIRSEFQSTLNEFMADRMEEEVFLKKVGFREHWFFDLWPNYKPVFDYAKQEKIKVYGMEAPSSLSASLKARDRAAAEVIFRVWKENPGKKIIVFVGDLHLAPQHLPLEVVKVFKREGGNFKPLILYQNSESIYWKLARQELEDQVSVVKVSSHEFCRMHTPPIICQQSYLNWLEHDGESLDYADAKQTFLNYLEQIATFMGFKPGSEKDEIQVFTCGDLSLIKRLRESRAFSTSEIREIKRQILRSESYYIPQKKYVYLANVSVNHASEEAANALRHLCVKHNPPRPMQDAFYSTILQRAMGFFGSKIINHKRKCREGSDYKKLLQLLTKNPLRQALEIRIAQLFLEHEALVKKEKSFTATKIGTFSVDLFIGLTKALGYALGDRMFYGLIQGAIPKQAIADLFHDPFDEDGEALAHFFDLTEKLSGVSLPRKL